MRLLYVLAVVLILVALGAGYFASEQLGKAQELSAKNDVLKNEIAEIEAEIASLEKEKEGTPLQVKFAEDALAEFYMRLTEAGEVLGAGVRIGSAMNNSPLQFAPVKYGLLVAPAVVEAAAESSGAPALFSMLEEEIDSMAVSVRKITITPRGKVTSLRFEIDVFGR